MFSRVKARSGSSQRQHQSAAKDLTQSPEVSPTTIQVTYLPSSQKSKRAKHFLELKSFKDNYNTLESTLWWGWWTLLCCWLCQWLQVIRLVGPAEVPQCPELLGFMPRGSFSSLFLQPVSENQDFIFPWQHFFLELNSDVFLNVSIDASLKILTWFWL